MSGGELVIMCYDEGADDIVRNKGKAVVSYYYYLTATGSSGASTLTSNTNGIQSPSTLFLTLVTTGCGTAGSEYFGVLQIRQLATFHNKTRPTFVTEGPNEGMLGVGAAP